MKEGQTQVWQQAMAIYADISNLSAQKALSHIDSIHDLSFELKQAVVTLINAGNQASQYIERNLTPDLQEFHNDIPEYKLGTILGEYELVEKLGQGGMSQVYKAKRLDSEPQKMVAIKIFSPRHNSPQLLDHFINEQKILAQFSHANIVDMLHGGKTDDTAYLVMELIDEALPIDKFCKENNLSIKDKIKYIAQCADALSYSHANLIIHRDLKPDNILINKDKELKIVDFGIAKLINNDSDGQNTTIMALTPNYAAPEQINSQPITVKTDIFSLAVVALDLLCGKNPLPNDRLIKSCINDDEFINKNLKQLNCDKDLKNILRKALAQNPDERYSSMQSFADDLNNWLDDKPVKATAPSVIYRVKKFAQRRTALFATLVSFFAFLIIGSILGYQQYKQIKIEANKAENVKQFMLDSFEVTDPDKAKGIDISAIDLLKLSREKLQLNTTLSPETKFDLLQTLGLAYGSLGQYTQAVELLTQSLSIMPNDSKSKSFMALYLFNSDKLSDLNELLITFDENDFISAADKLRIYKVKIKILAKNSEFDQAQELLDKATTFNNNILDTIDSLQLKRLQAQILSYKSQNSKAIELLRNILETTNLTNNHTQVIGIKSDIAELYDEIGNSEKAILYWQEVISQQREILGNRHPDLAKSTAGLSAAFRHIGEINKALETIVSAYKLSVELSGENSLTSAHILNTQAMLLFDKGEIDKAVELMYKVIKVYDAQETKDYLDAYVMKTNLATILSQAGRTSESYEIIKQVYKHNLKLLGKNHYDTISAQQLLARNLSNLGQHHKAVALAKLAVENAQMYLKESNSDVLFSTYYTLGKIYQANKQYQLGIENYLEIINTGVINPNDVKYAILVHAIAKIYHEAGQFEEAQNYYLQSIEKFNTIFGNTHPRYLMAQIKYGELLKEFNNNKKLEHLINSLNNLVNENNIKVKPFLEKLKLLELPTKTN